MLLFPRGRICLNIELPFLCNFEQGTKTTHADLNLKRGLDRRLRHKQH